ncbi:MAG: lytic transglycosylase domain-containing protein [Bacteriovoracaceae bacterium]|nr:lytic transglycosylase domain-containing protein [Bacteriovoracaceae bacterium]
MRASDTWHGSRSTDGDFLEIESVLEDHVSTIQVQTAKAALDDETTNRILSDYQQLIPNEFKSSEYFSPFVRFWFGVYTRYTSSHIVIHDKEDLGIVYGVLDFSNVSGNQITKFARASILESITKEKTNEVKNVLKELSEGKTESRHALTVLKILQDSGSPPPAESFARKKYFLSKLNNIRTQTGQRNLIEGGIARMSPYSLFLKDIFHEFQLPPELLSIPFLESSFNNNAYSKVGASGVWQFMPLIASYFMPKKTKFIDYRNNPLISSVAALHLLSENKKILKSWDLAVTAYNSGTKHLVKARRELGVSSLEEIFKNYSHPHLGFASKNFYAEFIALVYTLAYRDEIFPAEKSIKPYSKNTINFFMAKCNLKTKDILDSASADFKDLNPHFDWKQKSLSRGTIVVSAAELGQKFLKISYASAASSRPHKWMAQYLKNYNCSTR